MFDGWKSGQGKETKTVTGGITVIYSRIGEKADAVIQRIISKDNREWIVITSDRDIIRHAWASGCIPIPSENFLRVFEAAGQSDTEEETTESEEYQRKGNPRTPSKKEKALRRAFRKL